MFLLDFIFPDSPSPPGELSFKEKMDIWNNNIDPTKYYTIDMVFARNPEKLKDLGANYGAGLIGARIKGEIVEDYYGYEWIDGNQIEDDFLQDGDTFKVSYIAEKGIAPDVLFDRYLKMRELDDYDIKVINNIKYSGDVVFNLNPNIEQKMLLQVENGIETMFNKFDLESITLQEFIKLLQQKFIEPDMTEKLIINPNLDFVWRGDLNSKGLMQGNGFLYIKRGKDARIFSGYFDMGHLLEGKEYEVDTSGKASILYEGEFTSNLIYRNNLNQILKLSGIISIEDREIEYDIHTHMKPYLRMTGY